ncbi:FAD-dependent monooxygenase [Limnoglobus roseus]|uniref:3-(3-hydroxyphenyl)propionate hydroxylase n=1 Tax=Limnoglobus roseus TaxID=2598579 RepID=A0A5C1AHR9_9BACT|nr:FAD-dependent monooxygenase [Limnoglobus roseus]QEL16674.1 3-(3-hydroxyphenyl)propionate hydroxylase [Limnoglobus roseus]
MNQTDVLIVGAGPTGLTLAIDLARRSIHCRIIDKSPLFFPGSRAKGVMPRTLEVFDDLGIVDAMVAAGGPFPPFRGYHGEAVLWDRTIHQMGGFPVLEPSPDVPYAQFHMVAQWRTEEVLRDRFATLGGRVELATELSGIEQDGDAVTATFATGESVRCRYLVGADGGASFVRKSMGVSFVGETDATDRSIIADVKAAGPDRDHWHMWTNPGNPANRVSLCPLPGTEYFQFVAPVTTDDVPDLTLEPLQGIFDRRSGVTGVRLTDLRWATVYRVNVRMAERFRVGRVFLAGDAAHVHSPAGGQGLNTGIQDAYNLGWKLGAVLAGASEALLDTYEAERLPVAANLLGITSALHKQGFWSKGAAPQNADIDINQLKLNYRGGPVSQGRSAGPLQPGDRAPDAPRRTGGRLFDVFRGPHSTLLAFEPATGKYGDSVRVCSVAPDEAEVRRIYGIEHGYVLVRPDGYVGLIAPDEAAVRRIEYLC